MATDPLQGVDWASITKRLTLFAKRRLGDRGGIEEAEQIAFDAVTMFFDPSYKDWDPAKEPDLLRHLGSVVNGIIRNWVRKKTETLLGDSSDGEAIGNLPGEGACGAEYQEERVFAKQVLTRLLDRVQADTLVTDIVMLEVEGISDAREQAMRLGRSRPEIYRARNRLQDYKAAVESELNSEDLKEEPHVRKA